MAEFNLTYYKDEDRYSDGNIEEVMLDMAKRGISYEELPRNLRGWYFRRCRACR